MSNSTLLMEQTSDVVAALDTSALNVDLHAAGDNTTTYTLAQIQAEYEPAGITFDDLADSNAQNIARKIGFLILLAQLITVIFKGLGGGGGNLAMAYGAGGGVMTRLICTVLAVFMLTDIRVIPPIVDLLQEGIVYIGNWVFQSIDEDTSSGYQYTY